MDRIERGDGMYLTGAKQLNLDAKGRLTLPAEYRRSLGESVCLVPVADCVYGFTAEDYPTWVESLFPEGFNPRNAKDVALKRALDSSTVTVDLDSAGRVALGKVPTEARCSRGLDKAVTVIGSGDHFEVWDTERWEREQASLSADLSALMFDAS